MAWMVLLLRVCAIGALLRPLCSADCSPTAGCGELDGQQRDEMSLLQVRRIVELGSRRLPEESPEAEALDGGGASKRMMAEALIQFPTNAEQTPWEPSSKSVLLPVWNELERIAVEETGKKASEKIDTQGPSKSEPANRPRKLNPTHVRQNVVMNNPPKESEMTAVAQPTPERITAEDFEKAIDWRGPPSEIMRQLQGPASRSRAPGEDVSIGNPPMGDDALEELSMRVKKESAAVTDATAEKTNAMAMEREDVEKAEAAQDNAEKAAAAAVESLAKAAAAAKEAAKWNAAAEAQRLTVEKATAAEKAAMEDDAAAGNAAAAARAAEAKAAANRAAAEQLAKAKQSAANKEMAAGTRWNPGASRWNAAAAWWNATAAADQEQFPIRGSRSMTAEQDARGDYVPAEQQAAAAKDAMREGLQNEYQERQLQQAEANAKLPVSAELAEAKAKGEVRNFSGGSQDQTAENN